MSEKDVLKFEEKVEVSTDEYTDKLVKALVKCKEDFNKMVRSGKIFRITFGDFFVDWAEKYRDASKEAMYIWYNQYNPTLYRDRNKKLYTFIDIVQDDIYSVPYVDMGYWNYKGGGHRVDIEYIYDHIFLKGYHGGAKRGIPIRKDGEDPTYNGKNGQPWKNMPNKNKIFWIPPTQTKPIPVLFNVMKNKIDKEKDKDFDDNLDKWIDKIMDEIFKNFNKYIK